MGIDHSNFVSMTRQEAIHLLKRLEEIENNDSKRGYTPAELGETRTFLSRQAYTQVSGLHVLERGNNEQVMRTRMGVPDEAKKILTEQGEKSLFVFPQYLNPDRIEHFRTMLGLAITESLSLGRPLTDKSQVICRELEPVKPQGNCRAKEARINLAVRESDDAFSVVADPEISEPSGGF